MSDAITTQNMSKYFTTPHGTVRALERVSLGLQAGAVTAIAGPSGSGKTTLLSILGGLEEPSEGTVLIEGEPRSDRFKDLTSYRLRHVGFVFQSGNLFAHMTALENVMAPMELAGMARSEARARSVALLGSVGIGPDRMNHLPLRLSGGQQQRVALARALGNSPRLLLADEPTGNLDAENGRQVFRLLASLAAEHGICVIVVTHDLELARQADRVVQMRDGRVASDSEPAATRR